MVRGDMKLAVVWAILLLIVSGCGGTNAATAPADGGKEGASSSAGPRAAVETEPVQMPVRVKEPADDEFTGIAVDGYLRKNLRMNEFGGYPLADLCRDLKVALSVPANPPEYRNIMLPYRMRLGEGQTAAVLTLNTGDKKTVRWMEFPEGASGTYIVRQNGKSIPMKSPPFAYRGGGPFIKLATFIKLMDLQDSQESGIHRIGAGRNGDIAGKVLDRRSLKWDDKSQTELQLDYVYDPADKPRYRTVELKIGKQRITLLDPAHRGSSDYYAEGYAEAAGGPGDKWIQVHLDEDTVILKQRDTGWEPVFSTPDYVPDVQGFSLVTAAGGKAVFEDQTSHTEKKLAVTAGQPGTRYPLQLLSFDHLNFDEKTRQMKLTAELGAWDGNRIIFRAQMDFVYDGRKFVPRFISSWDQSKYSEDKSSGKPVSSMDDYLLFSYSLR